MAKKTATSIRFEDHVLPIKDYYSAIYGLKNLVSAGVLLFARLPEPQKKNIIIEVNKMPPEMAGMVDEILAALDAVVKKRTQGKRCHAKPDKSA